MSITYICSPYRGETTEAVVRHTSYAAHLTTEAIRAGEVPITPHLYIPQALNDRDPEERQLALDIGLRLLCQCTRMIVGLRFGISDGMKDEIEAAVAGGIPILWIDAKPEDIARIEAFIYQKPARHENGILVENIF